MQIPEINLFSREEIQKIIIIENNDPLIDIHETQNIFLRNDGSKWLVPKLRKTVWEMLQNASENLPEKYSFMVMSAYIPISLQQEVWNSKYKKISKKYWYLPKFLKEKIIRKYAAYPKIGEPHNTGGAVDVVILDENKIPLDMGSNFGEASEKSHTRYQDLTIIQKKNRELLYWTMTNSGLINTNPFEWWHYSYGDKTWAIYTAKKQGFYEGIE